jgi:hypothetical protein
MSVPERNLEKISAFEDVRVNLGSTLINFAPFSWALVTHLKEIGWFSAALDPIIIIQSLLPISIQ